MFIAVAMSLLPSSIAAAHKLPVRRELLIEPGARQLDVVASINVPAGSPRTAALTVVDLDHDGKLDHREEEQLRALLIDRALDGVRLLVGNATVALSGVESKLRTPIDPAEPLVLMLHGTVPLTDAGALRLVIKNEPFGDPVALTLLPGARALRGVSRGTLNRGKLELELALGDRLSFSIGPAP
jgi:hypothetical protein